MYERFPNCAGSLLRDQHQFVPLRYRQRADHIAITRVGLDGNNALPELRGVIDQVDAQILQLLAERGRLAAEVGAMAAS